MTTYNKEMTLEEAQRLMKSRTGMCYPLTDHNRIVMKQAIDIHLKTLRK